MIVEGKKKLVIFHVILDLTVNGRARKKYNATCPTRTAIPVISPLPKSISSERREREEIIIMVFTTVQLIL